MHLILFTYTNDESVLQIKQNHNQRDPKNNNNNKLWMNIHYIQVYNHKMQVNKNRQRKGEQIKLAA